MSKVFKRMGSAMRSVSLRDTFNQLSNPKIIWFIGGTFIFAKIFQIYDKIKMSIVLQKLYFNYLLEHKSALKELVSSRELFQDIMTSDKIMGDRLALQALSENDLDELEDLI